MDTAGATQSCASKTLGTRCFGLHDGPANLVDAGGLTTASTLFVSLMFVICPGAGQFT